jgi:hypothetical protein
MPSLLERGDNLPRRVTFGILAPVKSPHFHVVLHHGAFLQFVPDELRLIGTGCLEKLLELVGELPLLALEIMLSGGDELLIGVTNILVVVTLITVGGNRDLLGPLLRPLLSLLALLFAPLSIVLGGAPRPPLGATFPLL